MAARRATVVQSLSIALIVFVMLTFILAVTTYLFFTQKVVEEGRTREALAAAEEATRKLDTLAAEKDELQKIIGFDPEQEFDAVKAATDESFETQFGDFKEDPRSYASLAKWLQSAIKDKDAQLLKLEADKAALADAHAKELAARDEALDAKQKELEKAGEDAASEKRKFDEDRTRIEQEKEQLAADYQTALKKASSLEQLEEEIGKGEPLVSAARQNRFASQTSAERVGTLLQELRDRERAIAQANALLGSLRVADTALQETVLAATPKDDRIDGFDGRIVSMNDAERTVLMLCESTRGMRPGLLLYVYDPADPKPQISSRKAVVEVIEVESPTLARARVRSDSTADPILAGDGVATSLWTPGADFATVILGYVQLDRDEKPDADRLQEMIEGVGGRVDETVTPQTTVVIDAGVPRTIGDERAVGWGPRDETRREKELREARRLGIRVVGFDEFLGQFGLQRDSLNESRLPSRGSIQPSVVRQPPGR